jgi:predicted DNA-binding transcriptional regulator YafY
LILTQELAASRRGVPLKTVADKHGWRLRTVYRDIASLQAAHIPVLEEGGRYRVPADWIAAARKALSSDEIAGLFTARLLAGGLAQTSVGRALDRLWSKWSGANDSPPMLFPQSPTHLAVRTPIGIDYAFHRRTIATLETALAERRAVSTHYLAMSTGQLTSRVIEPGELYWDPTLETLYLIGFCRLRQDVRVFAVHRFRTVSITRDSILVRRGFTSRVALRHAFRAWRSGALQTVVVRFSATAAREIEERTWHRSQQLRKLPHGEVELALEVAGLDEIKRWLLGFGGAARVLAPAALREAIHEDAAALVRLHEAAAPMRRKKL